MELTPKTHKPKFKALVQELKDNVQEIMPQSLDALRASNPQNTVIIDIREKEEHLSLPAINGALHLPKGILERDIESLLDDKNPKSIIVYCSGGFRSIIAVNSLLKMGYTGVYSLCGGLKAYIKYQNDAL